MQLKVLALQRDQYHSKRPNTLVHVGSQSLSHLVDSWLKSGCCTFHRTCRDIGEQSIVPPNPDRGMNRLTSDGGGVGVNA